MAPASVYIGGLPDYITRAELHDHLSIYGKVNALNKQKGFSFVEFESESDASDFVATFSDQLFLGSECKIEIAKQARRNSRASETSPTHASGSQPRSAPPQFRVRYPVVVQNLNPQTCWQELKDFGRQLGGTVAFCDVDKNNRRQGFLEFYKQEDAELVVKELNGKNLLGSRVTLSSYGRKTLREEHARSRSRSPTINRDNRARRSRSPLESSGKHNTTVTRGSPTSARRRGRATKDSGHFEPQGHDNGYAARHEGRSVHFAKGGDPVRKIFAPRSRSPGKRMADFNEDLYYASDERKIQMERIAEEWTTYNEALSPPSAVSQGSTHFPIVSLPASS